MRETMIPDEVDERIRGEVVRCSARAADLAAMLESVAEQALDAATDFFGDDEADSLQKTSHGIRGLVVNALVILSELQCVAGQLDALAALRRAASDMRCSPDETAQPHARGATGHTGQA